jgi:nucleotide-binding universal stress UspA family protein
MCDESLPVCSAILAKADQHDCDIIVIGSHGKGALNHTMLGSVAQRLLRSTRKPVLVVPL